MNDEPEYFDSYVWREVSAVAFYQGLEGDSLSRPLVAFLCFMCFAIGAVFIDLEPTPKPVPPVPVTMEWPTCEEGETLRIRNWVAQDDAVRAYECIAFADAAPLPSDSIAGFFPGDPEYTRFWMEIASDTAFSEYVEWDTMWVETLTRWETTWINAPLWVFGDESSGPRERCVYCETNMPWYNR